MSFASSVKDEIALYKDNEYVKDELTALFKAQGSFGFANGTKYIQFQSENAKIAQMAFIKIHTLYDVKPLTSVYKSMKLKKNNVYRIRIVDKVNEIMNDLFLNDFSEENQDAFINNYRNIIRSTKRASSYLAGCFLGCGSVNDPKTTNYHLEMSFQSEDYAKLIAKLMEKLNLSPRIVKRRSQYVVYIKKAQEIADFIAHIGATNCYLDFEDERMTRDYYNNENRFTNCDIANSVRTNLAAIDQIKSINIIKDNLGLDKLNDDLKALCILRLDNPEDSLKELAAKFNEERNANYTKSGINHLFAKIKSIASSYQGGK